MSLELEMVLRLLLAAFLGALIGAERERLNRAAGLRTHALVCTSSALIILVSTYGFQPALHLGLVVLDPSRMAAQVVSGIGFLGAGIIIFRTNALRGITTAASIWAVAAVGLAIGAGMYLVGIAATVIMSFILAVMKVAERKFFSNKQVNVLHIELDQNSIHTVADKLKASDLKILNMAVEFNKYGKRVLKVETLAKEKIVVALFEQLQAMPGVRSVSYTGKVLPLSSAAQDILDDLDDGE